MSTISAQLDGLRNLARLVSPAHLVRSGAVARKTEAEYLISLLKDAARTMEIAKEQGKLDD